MHQILCLSASQHDPLIVKILALVDHVPMPGTTPMALQPILPLQITPWFSPCVHFFFSLWPIETTTTSHNLPCGVHFGRTKCIDAGDSKL